MSRGLAGVGGTVGSALFAGLGHPDHHVSRLAVGIGKVGDRGELGLGDAGNAVRRQVERVGPFRLVQCRELALSQPSRRRGGLAGVSS